MKNSRKVMAVCYKYMKQKLTSHRIHSIKIYEWYSLQSETARISKPSHNRQTGSVTDQWLWPEWPTPCNNPQPAAVGLSAAPGQCGSPRCVCVLPALPSQSGNKHNLVVLGTGNKVFKCWEMTNWELDSVAVGKERTVALWEQAIISNSQCK